MNRGKNKRDTSIELLRIISMLMIVFHHFGVHGGFDWEVRSITIPHFWINLLIMGGKIGVDIFVLISGYYLIYSKDTLPKLPRIIKFWFQVLFYSITIYLIYVLSGNVVFDIKSLIKCFLPITFSSWWFASTYFVLYLIHPFLNRLLHNLEKSYFQKFCVLLLVCWCIMPTITTQSFESNLLLWFITLYSIAGYIRIYGLNKQFTTRYYFLLSGFFSLITYFSGVVFIILESRWNIFYSWETYFYGQQKLTIFLISLSLFMAFITMEYKYNKWINYIASATFGVYLIHDHDFVRYTLWLNIFKNSTYQGSLLIIPYSILVVLIVFISCTIIDLIRQMLFEKPFMALINKQYTLYTLFLTKTLNYINRCFFGNE